MVPLVRLQVELCFVVDFADWNLTDYDYTADALVNSEIEKFSVSAPPHLHSVPDSMEEQDFRR